MDQINQKIIQRAMAKSMVHDTSDLIKLIKKYRPISKQISYADLIFTVQDLLATNDNFVEDYTNFLVKKGRLLDYNNAIGVFSGISSLFGSIIGSGAEKKTAQAQQAEAMSENTQQLMQMVMQEEAGRVEAEKQKSTLIYIAIGSMVLITSILIFTKNVK